MVDLEDAPVAHWARVVLGAVVVGGLMLLACRVVASALWPEELFDRTLVLVVIAVWTNVLHEHHGRRRVGPLEPWRTWLVRNVAEGTAFACLAVVVCTVLEPATWSSDGPAELRWAVLLAGVLGASGWFAGLARVAGRGGPDGVGVRFGRL